MKIMTALATIAAAVALATMASAQDNGQHQPGAHRGGAGLFEHLLPPPLLEKLNLTADQKPKYDELDAAFAKDAKEFWASHADLREKMKAAREAGDHDKMQALREELKPLMETRKGYAEKLQALLTDEQKQTIKDSMEKMRQQHGQGGAGQGGPHVPKDAKPTQ